MLHAGEEHGGHLHDQEGEGEAAVTEEHQYKSLLQVVKILWHRRRQLPQMFLVSFTPDYDDRDRNGKKWDPKSN